ncbi:MAG TPA: hypothetical protein VK961_21475 [Chthoniobacter sp.]|nr:hypothetical protein [Chthoniobacter sp.]
MKEQPFVHPASQPPRPGSPSQIGAYFAWALFLAGVGCLLKLPAISPWFIVPGVISIAGGIALGWRNRRSLWQIGERREDLRKLHSGTS